MDGTELYVHLGEWDNILFFLHVKNGNEDKYITFRIYDCLVKELIIKGPHQSVVIYEIYDENIEAIIIQHSDCKNRLFPNDQLENALAYFLSNDRFNLMAIEYCNKKYSVCNIPGKVASFTLDPKIDAVSYVISTRPL